LKVPISKPFFGEEERRAIAEPLETGWVVQGPRVAEFERLFCAFTKAPHAIATTSCTTALHLALVAHGIGPGDEVIVPAFTWIATANVVETVGATPVFIDVTLDTFNLDVTQLASKVTPRTKAIMPVSLFGVSADMAAVLAVAKEQGLCVIEDDACALGTFDHGMHAGMLADCGCFSFHPRKAITTGEGGMLITGDADIAERVRSLRDHGASKSDLARHVGARSYVLPDFDRVGFNYRMTDLQGALGVAQMGRLGEIRQARAARARRYDEALSRLPWLRAPVVPEATSHGLQAYVTLFQPEPPTLANVAELHAQRNRLMDRLEAVGVATRPGTHAVHMLGFYRNRYHLKPEDHPGAFMADQLTITLPLYPQMTDAEQDHVIANLTL
jgi:perosamine synthetase